MNAADKIQNAGVGSKHVDGGKPAAKLWIREIHSQNSALYFEGNRWDQNRHYRGDHAGNAVLVSPEFIRGFDFEYSVEPVRRAITKAKSDGAEAIVLAVIWA